VTARKKKAGRPPLPPKHRKVRNVTFRSRDDLYGELQAAAAKSGRSLSEEIERRLEKSFSSSDPLLSALAGEEAGVILRLVAVVLLQATREGKSWFENRELVETVSGAADVIIARVAGVFEEEVASDEIRKQPLSVEPIAKTPKLRGRELAANILRDAGLPY
jgi:hypothetical protein